MIELFIHFNELLPEKDLLSCLNNLDLQNYLKVQVHLLSTYNVQNISDFNAIDENDRIKNSLRCKLSNLSHQINQRIKNVEIFEFVKLGSPSNIIPRYLSKTNFDLILTDSYTARLCNLERNKETFVSNIKTYNFYTNHSHALSSS